MDTSTEIVEGTATIATFGRVFYNPVQEFNRDLSIAVLTAYINLLQNEKPRAEGQMLEVGKKGEDGVTILEALSATGLRSIRYAKELTGIRSIVANDISADAVNAIRSNVTRNQVDDLVTVENNDATVLMYKYKKYHFDVIDLDPYGCPSVFLDGAVQCIKDGGLLLVTATDMAVLAGNAPETCYSKYGAISLRMRSCHEMALRILLQCIESHANRYARYIVPLLCVSVDFYIRVFVRVFSGAHKCKFTLSKLSMVHHCTGCSSFEFQPLGILKTNDKHNNVKFAIPTSRSFPQLLGNCQHCEQPFHIGGPIWSAPMQDQHFVEKVLQLAPNTLNTFKRINGILRVIQEELQDVVLYYTIDKLSGTVHCETPSMLVFRSALLNAGYDVSFVHSHKLAIKTNAPGIVIWDILRVWVKEHPVAEKWLRRDKITATILSRKPAAEYSFAIHPNANPESRRLGYIRFQANPTAFWGPGFRGSAMVGDTSEKKRRNQGKRKRDTTPLDNAAQLDE